jgi:mono/diheme cytochrome c family protein/plastocyanin
MKRDILALIVVGLILVAFPAGLFGYQVLRTQAAGMKVIEIAARAPSSGGFSPDHLELKAGETVRLRISSPDVVHGLSIPGLGVEIKEILPGKPVEVDVTPREPGRYAFACIRWCSIDHWRMRGTIEVVGPGYGMAEGPSTAEPPLYQRLGIDLDAPHPVTQITPAGDEPPSATRGAALNVALPANLAEADSRVALSPADAFQELRSEPANARLSDGGIWDLVALAWFKDVKPETFTEGKALFAQDCAACHGPEGKGDGPAGRYLPGLRGRAGDEAGAGMAGDMGVGTGATAALHPDEPAGPANFTDMSRILAQSDAALQGKILRGGMGTGMPEFGSVYTDEHLSALVAYIRTFAFQEQEARFGAR